MNISCPSCGVKHDTADHPDAFEIVCVCGYSILVPDENQMNAAENIPESNAPISMDMEDQSLAISLPPETIEPMENMFPETPVTSFDNLSAPEELPPEMPYDPLEVKNFEQTWSQKSPALTENTNKQTLHSITDRSVLSSFGQLLDSTYSLILSGLSEAQLKTLIEKCSVLIENRPWLKAHLETQKIELNKIKLDVPLVDLPEILAVEIYLQVYDLGGSCQFKKTS